MPHPAPAELVRGQRASVWRPLITTVLQHALPSARWVTRICKPSIIAQQLTGEDANVGVASEPVKMLPSSTLFLAFTQLSMQGFGGVMPFAYRTLVEHRRWLLESEFGHILAIAQILPGPTICNLSLMVGWRFGQLSGALAAFAGVLLAPMLLVILIGLIYANFATLPAVTHAIGGMTCVSPGLIVATALKIAMGLARAESRWLVRAAATLFATLAFLAVGLLRWPLIAVVIALAPFAIATACAQGDKQSGQ